MTQRPANLEHPEGSEKEPRSTPPSRSTQRRSTGTPSSPPAQSETAARPTGQGVSPGGNYASRPGGQGAGNAPARPASQGAPFNRPPAGGAPRAGAPEQGNRSSSGPVPYRPASSGPSRPGQGGYGQRPAGPGGQSYNGANGNAGRRPSGPPSGRGRPQNGRSGGRSNDRRPSAGGPVNGQGRAAVAVKPKPTEPVAIPPQIPVRDLAALLEVAPMEIIRELFKHNILANINQVITYESAAMVAKELGYETLEAAPPPTQSAQKPEASAPHHEANVVTRPPVVTVMGHVDHGKTSLLDAIRNTRVAAGEAGGITQHIGAYQVEINGRKITFLDTPGHEAFTAMRARGAQVTDIAVIVVAADDGVMPQTIEAIDHARAAHVPIIIALNKIDKPGANGDKVKQQLVDHGVVIEEYGGDVICVPVSAKKNIGIDDLLEMILLVADVEDLKANPNRPAQGTIIEARLDKNSGVTANALIQEGTLKLGDIIVVGTISGKVRAMFDDTGARIKKATPSTPVSILGLSEVPAAGDHLEVLADEKSARALVEQRRSAAHDATQANITLDTLYIQMQEGKVKELNLLVKADVQGSVEAIKHTLSRAGDENLKVRLIRDGVGNVSETDVHLATASKAIIIAFNVKVDDAAQRVAANEGVDIRHYSVIYKLMDDIDAALKGLLEPVYREQVDGHAEVMQTFKAGRRIIAGCRVTDGKLVRAAQVRVQRDGKVIHTGTIESLRRGKDDAREVLQGFECGILIEDYNDFQVGDIIETFSMVRV